MSSHAPLRYCVVFAGFAAKLVAPGCDLYQATVLISALHKPFEITVRTLEQVQGPCGENLNICEHGCIHLQGIHLFVDRGCVDSTSVNRQDVRACVRQLSLDIRASSFHLVILLICYIVAATSLTPELTRRFDLLRSWADESDSIKSETSVHSTPTQLLSQFVNTMSDTEPFLDRQPESPVFDSLPSAVKIMATSDNSCGVAIPIPSGGSPQNMQISPKRSDQTSPKRCADLLEDGSAKKAKQWTPHGLGAFNTAAIPPFPVPTVPTAVPAATTAVPALSAALSAVAPTNSSFETQMIEMMTVSQHRQSGFENMMIAQQTSLTQHQQTLTQKAAAWTQQQISMTQLTTQMGALQTSATAQQQQIDSSLKLSHDSLRVELFEKLEDFKNSIGTIPAATGKQELMAELKQYINEKAKTAAATTAANISTSTGSSGPRPVDIRALVPPMTSLKFIPRTIFLKGWCEFGKDSEQGLSSANALKLGVKITSMLDPGLLCHLHADMPRRFSAPF
jgi:hypothetical protein